jgi:hypothetical protein
MYAIPVAIIIIYMAGMVACMIKSSKDIKRVNRQRRGTKR